MGPDHHLLTNGIPTVSLTVFRLASMVPPLLNKARSEELRFRVGTQRARHRGCQKRWLAKISLLLMQSL
jgi:hypothetical protein